MFKNKKKTQLRNNIIIIIITVLFLMGIIAMAIFIPYEFFWLRLIPAVWAILITMFLVMFIVEVIRGIKNGRS
jgi:fatty acid desaturase